MIRLTGPPTCVITGVVLNALYATAPVNRSVFVIAPGDIVVSCTWLICSAGIVNNCGVADGDAFDENEVIPLALSFEWQPANAGSTRSRGHTLNMRRTPFILCACLMVSFWSLPPREVAPAPAGTMPAPAGSRVALRENSVLHPESPAGSPLRACTRNP